MARVTVIECEDEVTDGSGGTTLASLEAGELFQLTVCEGFCEETSNELEDIAGGGATLGSGSKEEEVGGGASSPDTDDTSETTESNASEDGTAEDDESSALSVILTSETVSSGILLLNAPCSTRLAQQVQEKTRTTQRPVKSHFRSMKITLTERANRLYRSGFLSQK